MKPPAKAPVADKGKTPQKRRSVARDAIAADLGFEVMSASVPRHILSEVKRRVGKRGFSQFVTRSLEHELLRENQLDFVADVEAHSGPFTAEELAWAERLLSS